MPARFVARALILVAAALTGCGAPPPMVSEPYAYHQPPVPPAPPPPVPAPPPAAAAAPFKVALLVPLSGANAALGHGILDAAQMALFRTGGERLTLLPRDTGGSAAGAAKAARAALADGARLILGPLLATEVAAVKPIAAEAHVNVIAFSTVTRLAGGNVYLMGFLPRQEVVREVGYAREKGLDSFAALAPDSPYGHLMADALREVASSSGGAVTDIEFYDPRGGDAKAAIAHLLPPAPAADMPHFVALMLPEGGARLQVLGRELQAAGLDKSRVHLLGSGLWDEPDIGREPALDGGWFAAPSPDTRQDFERRFVATYGHPPPRLASLGYDAAALAAVLAHQEGSDPFSRTALENPSGFTGVDGLFRFAPDGLVERGLGMLEVGPRGNVVISPAPDSFRNLGY